MLAYLSWECVFINIRILVASWTLTCMFTMDDNIDLIGDLQWTSFYLTVGEWVKSLTFTFSVDKRRASNLTRILVAVRGWVKCLLRLFWFWHCCIILLQQLCKHIASFVLNSTRLGLRSRWSAAHRPLLTMPCMTLLRIFAHVEQIVALTSQAVDLTAESISCKEGSACGRYYQVFWQAALQPTVRWQSLWSSCSSCYQGIYQLTITFIKTWYWPCCSQDGFSAFFCKGWQGVTHARCCGQAQARLRVWLQSCRHNLVTAYRWYTLWLQSKTPPPSVHRFNLRGCINTWLLVSRRLCRQAFILRLLNLCTVHIRRQQEGWSKAKNLIRKHQASRSNGLWAC